MHAKVNNAKVHKSAVISIKYGMTAQFVKLNFTLPPPPPLKPAEENDFLCTLFMCYSHSFRKINIFFIGLCIVMRAALLPFAFQTFAVYE